MPDDKNLIESKDFWALIMAAGSGSRFGLDIPKQFFKLGNKPVFLHSIQTLSLCCGIKGITVVVPCDWKNEAEHMLENDYLFKQLRERNSKIHIDFICGGGTRQQSVHIGLRYVKNMFSGIVLIHDAARPFVTSEKILEVVDGVKLCGAAVLAVPVKDTVKRRIRSKEGGFDVATGRIEKNLLIRDELILVQTPQGFLIDIALNAHELAEKDGFSGTDDCSLVERIGIFPKVVYGDYSNFKITTPDDVYR